MAAASAVLPLRIWFVLSFALAASALTATAFLSLRRVGLIAIISATGILIGVNARVQSRWNAEAQPPIDAASISWIDGRVIEMPIVREQGWSVRVRVLKVESETLRASARFSLDLFVSEPVSPGSLVSARVAGVARRFRGGWFAEADSMEVLAAPAPGRARLAVRSALSRAIDESAGDASGLLAALLLGTRDSLGVRTEELYRRAGVSHVLALSGMHLALLAALAVAITRPLFGRKVALVCGAVVALAYTLFIGFRPSLVRATIMCEFVLLLSFFRRQLHLVEVLGAAFLIQLTLQPVSVTAISFQLSYLALLGLAVITPVLYRETRPWIPAVVVGPLSAGLGAQIASSPLLLRTFGRFSPVGIVAGAVVGPLVALFMVSGVVATTLYLTGARFIAHISQTLLSTLGTLIERIVWWFSAVPQIVSERMSFPFAGFALLSLCGGLLAERRRLMWTGRP